MSEHAPPDPAATQETAIAEAASRQREVLESVLIAIPHSVFWKDCDSVYLGSNARFARIAGFDDPADLVGKVDYDLPWTRAESDFFRKCDVEVMSRGEPLIGIEESQQTAAGDDTWVITSKVPLRDESGKVFGILGMFVDISDRKRAEIERDELQRKLVVASRDAGKSEVANGVLHNVGNAINSIGVGVELVSDRLARSPVAVVERVAETLRPHEDDFAAFVRDDPRGAAVPALLIELSKTLLGEHRHLLAEVEQLRGQVRHVKDVVASQQAFARSCTAAEPVDPAAVVLEAVRMATAGTAAAGAGVEVATRLPAEATQLTVDRHLVLQVLVNLIHNARQAMPEAPHAGSITVVAAADAASRRFDFRVEDNGRGIDAATLPRLFEHGFTTRVDGHGFGLHAAALAAESMGGRLHAHSDGAGCGACFTLSVPLAAARSDRVAA